MMSLVCEGERNNQIKVDDDDSGGDDDDADDDDDVAPFLQNRHAW